MTRRLHPSLLIFGFALGLSACDGKAIDVTAAPDRAQATLGNSGDVVGECKALVTIINESVSKMSQPAHGGPASAELTQLSSDMDDTITRLSRVELTDAQLESFADRYRAMAGKLSSSAKGLAKAVEGFDPRGIQAAEKRFVAALKLEDPLVAELNQYCQKRRPSRPKTARR